MEDLEERWRRLCEGAGLGDDQERQFHRLVECHQTPPRAYHNLNHVEDCPRRFDEVRQLAEQPIAIEFAIWFHDALYDARGSDNELRSAELARDALAGLGAGEELIEAVFQLILATRHDSDLPPETNDEKLLVDIDLSILGQDAQVFDVYEEQIREECAWVASGVFCEKRRAVLLAFHARSQIYSTKFFRDRYERTARRNLERSISRLT